MGAGIDAERPERFAELLNETHPLPLVFTAEEIAHARRTGDPPPVLAVAFCCKEALRKALGAPYDWRQCELLWSPGGGDGPVPIRLAPELLREHALTGGLVVCPARCAVEEVAVVVYLFAATAPDAPA